jgi:hypothetical protein
VGETGYRPSCYVAHALDFDTAYRMNEIASQSCG